MASPELKALIESLRSQPTPENPTVEMLRQGLLGLTSQFPVPADVVCTPVEAGSVPAEWISAPSADTERVVLYLHGGGYYSGSIVTHRALAAGIARAAGVRALALDYRLAPEHPFPAAIDDALAAYRWLLAQGTPADHIAIVGDSAGGGLTLALLVALRDAGLPRPVAAVVLSPWVDLEGTGESMSQRAALDPVVTKESMLWASAMYLNGADPRSPLAAPLYADLSGLPPIYIQVGTAEVLYDDAMRFAERAQAAGVEITVDPWDEAFHVWHLASTLPEAREATDRIGEFLRKKL